MTARSRCGGALSSTCCQYTPTHFTKRWGSLSEEHSPAQPVLEPHWNLTWISLPCPAKQPLIDYSRQVCEHTMAACHPGPCFLSSLLGTEAAVGMVTFPVKVATFKDFFFFNFSGDTAPSVGHRVTWSCVIQASLGTEMCPWSQEGRTSSQRAQDSVEMHTGSPSLCVSPEPPEKPVLEPGDATGA